MDAYAAGLPHPPSELAWGGVFKRASARKNIVPVDDAAGSATRWRGFQMAIFDSPTDGAETPTATERPWQGAGVAQIPALPAESASA